MATRVRLTPRTVGGPVIGLLLFLASIGPAGVRANLRDWGEAVAIVDLGSALTWRWIAGFTGLGVMLWGILKPDPRHLVRLGLWRGRSRIPLDSLVDTNSAALTERAELEQTRANRDELNRLYQELSGRTEQLVLENERLNDTLTETVESLNAAHSQVTQLTNDATVQAGQLAQAEGQEKELHAQVQKLNSRLMDANKEFLRLRAENEDFQTQLAPPLPFPPEPLNKELVIAIRTYGLPAYDAMAKVLDEMFEPIRDDQGLVKFLPGLFSEGTGQRIKDARDRLVARLAASQSSEPFHPIWDAFQRTYAQELVFWVGRVNYFAPVNDKGRQKLSDWLALHDKYVERLTELGNAPDGEAIKATIEQIAEHGGVTYRQRLVDAINSPVPDTSGSSS